MEMNGIGVILDKHSLKWKPVFSLTFIKSSEKSSFMGIKLFITKHSAEDIASYRNRKLLNNNLSIMLAWNVDDGTEKRFAQTKANTHTP